MRLLLHFLFLFPALAFSQAALSPYDSLISIAEKHFKNKEYKAADAKYQEAFASMKGFGRNADIYNSFACQAMLGEKDTALVRLQRFVTGTRLSNAKKLNKDKHFKSLHSDSRWDTIIAIAKRNKVIKEKSLKEIKQRSKESAKAQKEIQGKYSPRLICTDIFGVKYDTENLKGKVLVLNFWATWCGPCKKEIPELNTLKEEFKNTDVVFLSFCSNVDSASRIKEFFLKTPFNYNAVIGTDARKAFEQYSVVSIPVNVIINKKGQVVFLQNGYAPGIPEEIKRKIQECLEND
jgi:thiol-disulfide isomerase/thioredoxin